MDTPIYILMILNEKDKLTRCFTDLAHKVAKCDSIIIIQAPYKAYERPNIKDDMNIRYLQNGEPTTNTYKHIMGIWNTCRR